MAGLQTLFLLLVAKHPANHYLLPLAVSLSFNMALVTYTLRRARKYNLCVATMSLLALGALGLSLSKVASALAAFRTVAKANVAFYERLSKKYDPSVRVDSYSCSSPQFALLFGDGYCHEHFAGLIRQRWPGISYFSIFDAKFVTADGRISPEAMLSTRPILYLYGSAQELEPRQSAFPKDASFAVLDRQGSLVLLEVRAAPGTPRELLLPRPALGLP
jgi:hypothetical protein